MNNPRREGIRVALTGGGTGGHIYPALAVAEVLSAQGIPLVYLGREGGLEQELAARAGIDFCPMSCLPWHRGNTASFFRAIPAHAAGFFQAVKMLKSFRPDSMLATGGFASFPAAAAAIFLGIPLVVHEQNAVMGLANRILSIKAHAIAGAFPIESLNGKGRFTLTGNPVRKSLLCGDREAARKELGIRQGEFFVLATGGSRGASTFNRVIPGSLGMLGNDTVIMLSCGARRSAEVKLSNLSGKPVPVETGNLAGSRPENEWARLVLMEYIHDMGKAYAAADLVICRSGAISLAEVSAMARPSITVPFPFSAGDHQLFNARVYEKAGASVLLEDHLITPEILARQINELKKDNKRLEKMAQAAKTLAFPDAAARIADIVMKSAGGAAYE